MTAQLKPNTLIQRDVIDSAGDKIGSVGHVYLDDGTKAPEWITVKTGLFGMKESFVPLLEAELRDDSLWVPYEKSTVRNAPRIDGDAHLEADQEAEIYRYYGLAHERSGGSRLAGSNDSSQAATEQGGSRRRRLSKYAATDHPVTEAHRERLSRGSGL